MTRRRAARAPGSRVRERAARYAGSIAGPVVVDASIACLWFSNEPGQQAAVRLLHTDAVLLAPDLMAVEAANAWWKKRRRGEMELADLEEAVTNLVALAITWTSSTTLLRPAIRLAVELGHPVYDCVYLALAASHPASLATVDDRLKRAAERVGVRIWRAA